MQQFIIMVFLTFSSTLSVFAHNTHGEHAIFVGQAWARETGNRLMSAAIYVDITNEGTAPDALVHVASPIAEKAQIHRTERTNDVMRMIHQTSLDIAAGKTAHLTPGGLHIMLMGLKQSLKKGDSFPLTLKFKDAGQITIFVDVTGVAGPEEH